MLNADIASLAGHAAARFGERIALSIPGEAGVSFATIDRLAGEFASGLRNLGVSVGDRVVLYLPNGRDFVVAYHAIARLGAVVVPANILLSIEEVAFILADSAAGALVTTSERGEEFVELDQLKVIVTGHEPAGTFGFDSLMGGVAVQSASVAADDLFTIGYTSGTTGRPKGAMLSHGNIFASLALTATMHVRHDGDVAYSALPFAHVYGNIVMNAAFLCGYRLVAPARFDAAEALDLIGSERVTLFEGVPTMYYQMLAVPELPSAELGSLVRCTVGGQTMPTAKLDQVAKRFGCPLLELWGMTEVSGPAITHSPYWPSRHGSIGLPAAGVEARLVSLDDASRLAVTGQPGELQVRGPIVMQGYWNNDAATRDTIDADGWLASGDIARADAQGHLYIVDRKKDMIITAGYNVYPAELEQVIAMLPDVTMVAVTGLPDDEKGEIACAVVVPAAGATLDEATVMAHCRKHLAAYKVPRRIAFAGDLPRTSTGKLMRRALPATLVAPV